MGQIGGELKCDRDPLLWSVILGAVVVSPPGVGMIPLLKIVSAIAVSLTDDIAL